MSGEMAEQDIDDAITYEGVEEWLERMAGEDHDCPPELIGEEDEL